MHKAIMSKGVMDPMYLDIRNTPSPKRGEVLIRVRACAVNPVDWKVQDRGYFQNPQELVFGIDGSGEIVKLGDGVIDRQVGDRVLFSGFYNRADTGTFQEYAISLARLTCPIPPRMTFEESAGIMTPAFTAYASLFHKTGMGLSEALPDPFPRDPDCVQVEEQILQRFASTIFVLGGSSNVGQYTIQFARKAGFNTIITTASPAHDDCLMALGATHVLRRDSPVEAFAKLAASSRGSYDFEPETIVMDCIAIKETQEQGGNIISTISPSKGGFMTNLDLLCAPLPKCVQVKGLFAIPGFLLELSVPFVSSLQGWLTNGDLKPVVVEVEQGLEKVPEAVSRLRKGMSGLKLVVSM
ncbi:hypothetical protein FRC03_004008 [Tulasnella sp. 419]|nr:hypothetical protein FRC02_009563 [Tulasnella sp. 418]KAG8962575.1 hypothetical protein FRC03_004008 [Tulasnella sp. 419]